MSDSIPGSGPSAAATVWRRELALAASAAREAGDHLTSLSGGTLAVAQETSRDIKLAADRESETLIVEHLRESGYAILAEEGGELGDVSGDKPVWVVDPLDGTMNFSRGIPLCCVSIALLSGGEPVLGVVHDFNRGETFTGLAEGGAWMNGAPVSVSRVEAADQAILATGLPALRDYSAEALAPLAKQFRRFRKVRMLGSAALMLAYLAAGRVDAYQEDDIQLWDVAAGLALVKGAGGFVSATPSARHQWGRHIRCGSRASIWA